MGTFDGALILYAVILLADRIGLLHAANGMILSSLSVALRFGVGVESYTVVFQSAYSLDMR